MVPAASPLGAQLQGLDFWEGGEVASSSDSRALLPVSSAPLCSHNGGVKVARGDESSGKVAKIATVMDTCWVSLACQEV